MKRFFLQLLITSLTILMLLTLQVGNLSAHPGGGVTSTLSLYKITHDEKGKEVLASAEKTEPGDLVEYQLKYKNEGDAAIRNLCATLPIPVGMAYLESTAKPAKAQASVDGTVFAVMPLTTTVKQNGKDVAVKVPCADYRDLRWTITELGAGKSVILTARAKVIGTVAGQTPPAN